MNDARDFHIDAFLSGFSLQYRPEGFIADQIFPVVPVAKQSDVFAKIDKGNWFRSSVADRAPGTLANEINYTVSSDTYFCPNYALRHPVAVEAVQNADPPHAPLLRGTEFLADKHMLNYEIRVYDTVVGGVGSVTTLAGTNIWSDFNNSDPMTDLEVAANAIQGTTGLEPNLCVMPRKVWQKVRRHPDIVQRVFPGAGIGGTVNLQQFGDLIGVERVLLARTIKNTSTEGAADTFTDVWSTHVHLLHVKANPGLNTATFAIAPRWNGDGTNGSPTAGQIERKYDDDRKVYWLRSGYYQDEKIVASELGFTIRTGIT